MARLKVATTQNAVLECAPPAQLEDLRAWREAGQERAFSLSAVNGCTLSEVREEGQWEAEYEHAGAAVAAIAAGAVKWHQVPTRIAARPAPEPVVRPKAAKPKSMSKLLRKPAAG